MICSPVAVSSYFGQRVETGAYFKKSRILEWTMGRAVSGKRYWTTRMMMVNADPELLLGNFSVHTWKKNKHWLCWGV